MSEPIQARLNEIIVESQQLLLLFNSDDEFVLSQLGSDEINAILNSRQQKFEAIFTQFSQAELSVYSEMLQQIVNLDQALINSVVEQKDSAKNQLTKLKKNQKAVKTYQQF